MHDSTLTAGVIGGLGPAATIDFMNRVLELTPATSDQDHLRLLVDQNPRVPDRQAAVLKGGETPGKVLASMAAGLEAAGSDFLVMPCNAAHMSQGDIENAIRIPFISIIETTVDAIPAGVTSVGVLETPACREAALYSSMLRDRGMEYLTPDADGREELLRLIYAIKGGDCGDSIRSAMKSLADALIARGAGAIILGCTEIPLVLCDDDVDVPLIASTAALAIRTVALARGEQPLPDSGNRTDGC